MSWACSDEIEPQMKNIQVIDGAENCSYSICLVSDKDFKVIFPVRGQDVEFAEDLARRLGRKQAAKVILRSTTRRIQKNTAIGIHGTLFFQMANRRKYFPNKRDTDIAMPAFVETPRQNKLRSRSKKSRAGIQ